VVFIDGLAYHGDQVAFQRDRTQGNLLELIGWRYLRFTFRDLVDHPLSVVDQVRRALSLSILA
jgi:very-short-patch-repair endonuclease